MAGSGRAAQCWMQTAAAVGELAEASAKVSVRPFVSELEASHNRGDLEEDPHTFR